MTRLAAIARRAAAHPEGVTEETLAEEADYARRAESLTPSVLAVLEAEDDAADGLSPSERDLELLGLPLDDDAHPDSAEYVERRTALETALAGGEQSAALALISRQARRAYAEAHALLTHPDPATRERAQDACREARRLMTECGEQTAADTWGLQ